MPRHLFVIQTKPAFVVRQRFLLPLAVMLQLLLPAGLRAAESAPSLPADARMSWLDNGVVRLGVDLNHGGAIVFLARDGGENVVNNFDRGRQVQLAFYGGPVPFSAGGQEPSAHWAHLGWNPIQAGDDFKNAPLILAHENDGRMLHVKCRPLQWPLNDVPGECTFDSWLELDGCTVKARARLTNARSDHTQYPARLQELPAAYANAPFHRVVSYMGDKPFTGGAISDAPKAQGAHPWSLWLGTEGWSALLDEHDRGLGLVTPGRVHFTGGFAGRPGPNDTLATHTGYLAGQGAEILDHNITFEYRYELVAGSLEEIRARAAVVRTTSLPAWIFSTDRQGWHFQNAGDTGWPVIGQLDVRLEKNDPQLISPLTFWRAEDSPLLIVEAAFHTADRKAVVLWQRHGETAPGKEDMRTFDIEPDGEFHRLVVRLADAPSYRGGITRLRIDPESAGRTGDWMKLWSVRLAREP